MGGKIPGNRGYKRYLSDPKEKIPKTTKWRIKKKKCVSNQNTYAVRGDEDCGATTSQQLQPVIQNAYTRSSSSTRSPEDDSDSICSRQDSTTTQPKQLHCQSLSKHALTCLDEQQLQRFNDDVEQEVEDLYDEGDDFDLDMQDRCSVSTNDLNPSQLHLDEPTPVTSILQSHQLVVESDSTSCLKSNVNAKNTQSLLTPADLMLLLMKLKHNLTKEATVDIGKMLNVVSGRNVASTTMHNIEKEFENAKDNVQVHHICKLCGSYVGIVASDIVHCNLAECMHRLPVKDSLKSGSFFFYLPLHHQLIELLENHNVSHLIYKPPANSNDNINFTDITNGGKYKCLQFKKGNACLNLTLTFNCDGVPVFKSSKFCIWPILCVVNELPLRERSRHILMAALWFGVDKPNMNVFMEPFVDECCKLADGFDWVCVESNTVYHCTATVIVGVCDAVARPLMLNFKQFNGHYGCSYCLDKGESVEKGNGRTTVYAFNADMELRTSDSTSAFIDESVATGKACMGIKGPSLLQLVPQFDMINGMVPDYMHCICLGVVRQMAKLWLDSKNHEELFYLGKVVSIIDARLLSIKPPCSLSRTPRSIAQLKYWKAHEWLAWLLYYSLPTLKDILPSNYYKHWAVLVDSVSVLLAAEVSLAQIVYSERCFKTFVKDFEVLYGKKNVTFNVHQTLHLANSVKNWGPLWAHSAFMFEAYNAVLMKMIKGTQGVPVQIFNTFCLTRAIPVNVRCVLTQCTPDEQLFIEDLTTRNRKIKDSFQLQNNPGVTLLGQAFYKSLRRSHFVALHSLSDSVNQTKIAYYNRAVIRGNIVHTSEYRKDLKRNSFTVKLYDGNYFQVVTFVVCDIGYGQNCYAIGRYLRTVSYQFCCHNFVNLKLKHINAVDKSPSALVAVPAADIVEKCLFVSLPDHNVDYVCNQLHCYDYCS